MDLEYIKNKGLPDSPGVYFFKDGEGNILYIGKAASLRDRVRSYFNRNTQESRGAIIGQMLERARSVDFSQTDSVLEALILEAKLIKKNQPPYNIKEKDDKSFNYVVITEEQFPKVVVVREKELSTNFSAKDIKYAFGPFPHASSLKEAMKIIRKIFPFRDNKCTPYFKQDDKNKGRPCFSRQVGLCPGVCTGEIGKGEYARRIQHLRLLFEGKKSALIKKLKKDMDAYAKNQEFEKAEEAKLRINNLQHIRDVSLLKDDEDIFREEEEANSEERISFRIEGYDAAHISGKNAVGVMVVIEDGEVKKSDYRRFKIKVAGSGDDAGALREILERRIKHSEWRYPSLIVVDGGETQRKTALRLLNEKDVEIPVVSVLKDERHKPKQILGPREFITSYKEQILLANSEAHRFAITYHRRKRDSIQK